MGWAQTWAPNEHGSEKEEVARPEGFEPPTNGFGSHYSIRLSYGREPRSVAAAVGAQPAPANAGLGVSLL